MIQADAHTNPFTWRRCLHTSLTASRCDDCGAIDHGPMPARASQVIGKVNTMAGFRLGYLSLDTTPGTSYTCQKGHARTDGKRRCATCMNERRERMLTEPCPSGHVGDRYIDTTDTMKCRACRKLSRVR